MMTSLRTVLACSIMVCLCIAAGSLAWGAGPSRNVSPAAVQPGATLVAPNVGSLPGTAPSKLFQGPAISLSKTVGTTAGVCAATSSITVPVGTAVEFCYTVQNTGTVALNYHDLVDDQLGTILDDFNFVLAPGASAFTLVSDTPMATVTNTATWTAVTSLAGYTADDTIPYNFEDISGTGTALALTDDSILQFPIGFTFDYFGTSYTSFFASSNGFLADNGTTNGCCTGDPLPNTDTPNGTIAGWWEDLNPSAGGTVQYQLMGAAPNRYVIVQYTAIQHYSSGNPVTMQFKLFETSNAIEVHYQAAPSDGGTHSAGIENQDGTAGVQYYLGTAALAAPLAVRYALVPVQSASDTASATVTVQAPNIDVSPLSLASTQMPNTTAQRTLTIANTGSLPLNWSIVEEPIAEAPDMLSGGTPALAGESIGPSDFKPGQSWGAPAVLSNWRAPEALLYDNGPLVTHPAGGAGGADASALQSAILLDTYGFGYQLTAGNRIADDFTVTGGGWFIETITFFGYQTGSSTTSTFTSMNLRIWDGPPDNPASMIVFGDTTTNRLTSSVWSNIYRALDTSLTASDRPIMANTVAVNTFLPSGTYWLDWQADGSASFSGPWAPPITILGQTNTGNAMQWTGSWAPALDVTFPQGFPFIIDGTSDCSNPVDVPWLSFSPIGGTTANGSSTPVTVTFDSTGLALGNYDARLCVFSDDPDVGPGNGTGLVVVPASLIVSQTAPSISVTKTVGTTAGVCATSSNITVPQGSTVYYCYTVTNTGDTAFAMHDLVDDQLGTIFSGLAYALAPGASIDTVTAGLSVSAVINVPTTNVGTWTAYNAAAGDGVQGQATATVNVTAAQAIPTLHGLGLLILVLLLAGAGVLALRRLS